MLEFGTPTVLKIETIGSLGSAGVPESQNHELYYGHINIYENIDISIYHTHQASIVIMVHTAVRHRRSRDLIRETWGASVLPKKSTRLLFAIGIVSSLYEI